MELITLQEAISTLENLLNSEKKDDILSTIKNYKDNNQVLLSEFN